MAAAWRVLGIERTADRGAIRRAYADRLRAMDPDADPDAYQDLRDARDAALAWAKTAAEEEMPVDEAAPAAAEPVEAKPKSGLKDLPITAPLIDRDVPAPVRGQTPAPPPPLRITGGERDCNVGDDIALPAGATFATPLLARADAAPVITILTNDAIVGAYDVYREIVLPGGEATVYALTDEERTAALAAIDRFMLDPRLEELEFRARTSEWIAAVTADAIPRSDPLLAHLATLFDWRASQGRLGEHPAVSRVNDRLSSLEYLTNIARPGHRHHTAWSELTRPADSGSFRNIFVSRKEVANLLLEIRQHHPEAELSLDRHRVDLWENSVGGPSRALWVILVGFFALALVMFAGDQGQDSSQTNVPTSSYANADDPALPPTPVMAQPEAGLSEPLSEVDRNLTSALLTLGNGFDVDRAKRENPGLYRELVALWHKTKESGGRLTDLDEAVSTYIEGRVDRAAQVAPVELATKLAQNSLDQALDIRRRLGDEACAAYFDASKPSSQSQDLARKRWRLLIGAVFAVPPKKLPAEPNYRYTIPGALVDEVRQRLDWSSERLTAAFDRNGPPADICRAEIGLREVVLDKPSAYLSVLRHM